MIGAIAERRAGGGHNIWEKGCNFKLRGQSSRPQGRGRREPRLEGQGCRRAICEGVFQVQKQQGQVRACQVHAGAAKATGQSPRGQGQLCLTDKETRAWRAMRPGAHSLETAKTETKPWFSALRGLTQPSCAPWPPCDSVCFIYDITRRWPFDLTISS